MTFAVAATAYDRFMGRYSAKLAPLFADFVGATPGMRVLDVGCGPGALTSELAARLGADHVAAIEPSATLVEACRARIPAADIRQGPAEQLPWSEHVFDGAYAQLVFSFVTDADQVAREMRRVVREGGTLGACMWHEGASLQLSDVFWQAVATIEPALRHAESKMRFRKQGDFAALLKRHGLRDVEETFLEVHATYSDFDDFWTPLLTSAGPVGAYMASANADQRAAIQDACRALLGDPQQPFELLGRACAARGVK
jgi:ubiquinone/menaquinone biosynthesis C-methylase UbiE